MIRAVKINFIYQNQFFIIFLNKTSEKVVTFVSP